MLAPLSADSIRLIEVRGGLGAVPGVRVTGVGQDDLVSMLDGG